MDPKHVPLTGYERYHQEIQTYPVNKEPLNIQPTTVNDNSALLDLPNVQTGLPEPLTPPSSKSSSVDSCRRRNKQSSPYGVKFSD